jgi:hypothetical protein
MRAIGMRVRSGLGWLSHSVAGKWRTVYICRYCTAVSALGFVDAGEEL